MIKHLLVTAANTFGVTNAIANSEWRRRRLLILCYHGISLHDEHEWNPGLYMPPDMFERRLRHLRKNNYAILPLAESLTRLKQGTLPKRSVALTFDDGAHDFAEVAVPLLSKYDAPATVYLTTHYVRWRYPVFDTGLSYLLWKGANSGQDLATLVQSKTPLLVTTAEQRSRTWTVVRNFAFAAELSSSEKNALLRDVAGKLGVTDDTLWARHLLHIMTEEQVRDLPPNITVELHTHRHRTPRNRDQFQVEIRRNREIIRDLRPHQAMPVHFCYPSGDYSRHFLSWLDESAVSSATTCVPGLSTTLTHPLLLPRFVDTTSQSLSMFDAWASGVAHFFPRRERFQLDPARE